MAAPSYLYAGGAIGLSGSTLAALTIAFTLSGTVSNLVWGALADRYGFRLAFLSSIALWVASTLGLMVTDGLLPTIIVFVGIGAAFQGFQQSAMNLTLEFGQRDDLPMRIALANSGSEAAGTIGPILGGYSPHPSATGPFSDVDLLSHSWGLDGCPLRPRTQARALKRTAADMVAVRGAPGRPRTIARGAVMPAQKGTTEGHRRRLQNRDRVAHSVRRGGIVRCRRKRTLCVRAQQCAFGRHVHGTQRHRPGRAP